MSVNTTLCYIRDDRGRYLMLLRNKKKNDLNEGKWVGVGGKLKACEAPDECLLREVKEETGLTLTEYAFKGIITFVSDQWEDEQMFLYEATGYTGELTWDCPEGELRWIPAGEILNLPLWAGDRVFLKPMLEGESDIRMRLAYEGDRLADVKIFSLHTPV